jgi:hypothetical protein
MEDGSVMVVLDVGMSRTRAVARVVGYIRVSVNASYSGAERQ